MRTQAGIIKRVSFFQEIALFPFGNFSLIPQCIHFRQGGLGRSVALFGQPAFNLSKPPLKFGIGSTQRHFGIKLKMTGQISHCEQDVAQFIRQPLRRRLRRDLVANLADFLFNLG